MATVKELRAQAKALKLRNYSKLKKADLIKFIIENSISAPPAYRPTPKPRRRRPVAGPRTGTAEILPSYESIRDDVPPNYYQDVKDLAKIAYDIFPKNMKGKDGAYSRLLNSGGYGSGSEYNPLLYFVMAFMYYSVFKRKCKCGDDKVYLISILVWAAQYKLKNQPLDDNITNLIIRQTKARNMDHQALTLMERKLRKNVNFAEFKRQTSHY